MFGLYFRGMGFAFCDWISPFKREIKEKRKKISKLFKRKNKRSKGEIKENEKRQRTRQEKNKKIKNFLIKKRKMLMCSCSSHAGCWYCSLGGGSGTWILLQAPDDTVSDCSCAASQSHSVILLSMYIEGNNITHSVCCYWWL